VSFIDKKKPGARACATLATAAVLAGCGVKAPAPSPAPAPPTQRPPVASPAPAPAPAAAQRARHWDEYRVLAAQRMVASNPTSTYLGVPPEPLLAIPVLEIELQADGQIARISVQRQPSQARDTVQLAIDAVKRSAPFGPVAHLPKPWKFSEVFLFDDNRRFKPRTLD
jgi:hypothetical protein